MDVPAPRSPDGARLPEAILTRAAEVFTVLVAQEFSRVFENVTGPDADGTIFTLKDLRVEGSQPRVRLQVVPLPGHQVARTFCNTISENNVIQLSDTLALTDIHAVLRVELASLVVQRRRAQLAAVSSLLAPEAPQHRLQGNEQFGDRSRLPQRFHYPIPGRHADGRPITRAELPDAVRQAAAARTRRSHETLSEIRRELARLRPGVYPKLPIMIGAGAAIAARDPDRLLIDTRQRWHIDRTRGLVQSADQVSQLHRIGMGDPYQFAAPRERLPVAALRLWEHTLALQGPLIDGLARLHVDDRSRLLLHIRPADGSAPVTVQVEGEPLIATGIAPQALPGCSLRVPSTADALVTLSRHLSAAPWAEAPRRSKRSPTSWTGTVPHRTHSTF